MPKQLEPSTCGQGHPCLMCAKQAHAETEAYLKETIEALEAPIAKVAASKPQGRKQRARKSTISRSKKAALAGKRLDQATKDKIQKMVASGKGLNEVATALGVGWQAAKRWGGTPGLKVTKLPAHVPGEESGKEEPALRQARAVKPKVRKLDLALMAKLVERHKGGESVTDLAAEAGLKPHQLYQFTNPSGQARLNGLLHES